MNNIKELTSKILKQRFEDIAPDFRKGVLSGDEIDSIIEKIAKELDISSEEALTGVMLLMLKGAASSGTPQTLSVLLKGGKTLAKKNVYAAYVSVTGNEFLRRLAEGLAVSIGEFAENFSLEGELSQRINTSLKAETGEILNAKEIAWCSSFSQNIPDLAKRSSERLVKLLAEDYKKRFENKKKSKESTQKGKNTKKGKTKNNK